MAGCELLLESLGLLGGNDELDFDDGEDTVQVIVVRETDDINNEDVEMMEVDQEIMDVDGYPTVSFKRLTLSLQGTIDGVNNLLSSSPKLLIHPNQTQNLRVIFSDDNKLQKPESREDLNKFFSPLLLCELANEIASNFRSTDATRRHFAINWDSIQVSPYGSDMWQIVLECQLQESDILDYQQIFANSLLLLMRNNSCSKISLLLDEEYTSNATMLIYIRSLIHVEDSVPRGDWPPLWGTTAGKGVARNATLKVVKAKAIFSKQYLPLLGDIKNEGNNGVEVMCLGKVTQYIRYLRMISIPNLPASLSESDYNVSPLYDASIIPTKFNQSYPFENATSIDHKFDILNKAMDPTILIVEGGPGTAKTATTLNHLARLYSSRRRDEQFKALICAPSNTAVDLLFLRLTSMLPNAIAVRCGRESRFSKNVKQAADRITKSFWERRTDEQTKRDSLTAKQARSTIITAADFVFVTLGSSQISELTTIRDQLDFTILLIDEAGQANTCEYLFPLYFKTINRLIIVGDPFQLGPTFLSHKLSSFPPQEVIMFTRLYNIFKQIQPSAVICLREQYRMRREVADVVNCITYSGDDILTTPSTGNWRRTLKHPSFLLFSGEKWIESKKIPTMSCFNEAEANFGINLVIASLRLAGYDFRNGNFFRGAQPLSYAIICLYRAQVEIYQNLIDQHHLSGVVTVNTVDAFQGSEVDIVILSAVRGSYANDNSGIGFARDLRRLNVALSRGACVYVLANHSAFMENQGWKKLFDYAIENNVVYSSADNLTNTHQIYDLLRRHV